MSSSRGFTLIEAVVSILIAAFVVIGVGGLGERLVHHRTTTDSNSAALNVAEYQMEKLLANPNRNPAAVDCPTSGTAADLCGCSITAQFGPCTINNGWRHGPSNVDERGNPSASGPYRVEWKVVDIDSNAASPLITFAGAPTAKRLTVSVTHLNNPQVNAKVVTYYFPPPA